MNMAVNVDFSAGISIRDAVSEALEFATRNDCFVRFLFNGISMLVCKQSDNPAKDINWFCNFYQEQRKFWDEQHRIKNFESPDSEKNPNTDYGTTYHWGFIKYDEACCSKCGHIISLPFYSTNEAREKWNDELPNYCENCGAKMDKTVDPKIPKPKSTKPHKTTCARGKTTGVGCEFLEKNGMCSGVVYPTYPPQYDKCPFAH